MKCETAKPAGRRFVPITRQGDLPEFCDEFQIVVEKCHRFRLTFLEIAA
jgi:hypothetical protein